GSAAQRVTSNPGATMNDLRSISGSGSGILASCWARAADGASAIAHAITMRFMIDPYRLAATRSLRSGARRAMPRAPLRRLRVAAKRQCGWRCHERPLLGGLAFLDGVVFHISYRADDVSLLEQEDLPFSASPAFGVAVKR